MVVDSNHIRFIDKIRAIRFCEARYVGVQFIT